MSAPLDTYHAPTPPKPLGNYRGSTDPAETVSSRGESLKADVEELGHTIATKLRESNVPEPIASLGRFYGDEGDPDLSDLAPFAEGLSAAGRKDVARLVEDLAMAVMRLRQWEMRR